MELRNELELASVKMQSYRPERIFTNLEKILSLMAFSQWLKYGEIAIDNGIEEYHFGSPNVSGRKIAVTFVYKVLSEPEILSKIKEFNPNFDPVQELDWSRQRLNHEEWNNCLTRAIIILCRGLAYSYTGVLGYESDILKLINSEFARKEAENLFRIEFEYDGIITGFD